VRRYEAKRPAMETEMTPLKAVVEPMLMSARRAAMKAVAATALTGIEVLSLIYCKVSEIPAIKFEKLPCSDGAIPEGPYP